MHAGLCRSRSQAAWTDVFSFCLKCGEPQESQFICNVIFRHVIFRHICGGHFLHLNCGATAESGILWRRNKQALLLEDVVLHVKLFTE